MTLYAATQEVAYEQQSWDASKVVFQDTSVADQETLFSFVPMARHKFGGPNVALRGGGGGRMGVRRRRRRGGVFQKWASVPGPLFCVRTVVATKGAGAQIFARETFFHSKIFPHICVVKMISASWGSF